MFQSDVYVHEEKGAVTIVVGFLPLLPFLPSSLPAPPPPSDPRPPQPLPASSSNSSSTGRLIFTFLPSFTHYPRSCTHLHIFIVILTPASAPLHPHTLISLFLSSHPLLHTYPHIHLIHIPLSTQPHAIIHSFLILPLFPSLSLPSTPTIMYA